MQNINYNLEMEKIIEQLDFQQKKPRLLLQVCCAPCSSHCLEVLKKYFTITIYFYNPNIYPAEEYATRAAQIDILTDSMGISNDIDVVIPDYNSSDFYDIIHGLENEREGGGRCTRCFELRLANTANFAKLNCYDFFTTSLTISPHKNAQLINRIGLEMQERYGVQYLPADFKKKNGYKRSIELSKEYGLYRQDYCGCEFSLPTEPDTSQ